MTWTGKANPCKRQRFVQEYYACRHAICRWITVEYVSYGKLDAKGCQLKYLEDGSRVVQHTSDEAIVFQVKAEKNVLDIETDSRRSSSSVLDMLAAVESNNDPKIQIGRLQQFHHRFGNLNYYTIERIAKMQDSGIKIDDHRRPK
uniref:AlNc14C493G11923 protein n=1 Tax=Albugo laibachii Nc14 TaxID=890382 RepID=F0X0H9_9STRA|nr:AlNc14C493G11923 [Albugo laibachii Nc14]|eukprot:CCA27269.1 AlNc14C493G11923 [Albugo laibachii Nc14]